MNEKRELAKPLSFSGNELGVNDVFGAYRGIKGGGVRKHSGIDIYRDKGTLVRASLDGNVIRASVEEEHESYGGLVIIDHTPEADPNERHIYTLYAHLDSIRTIVDRSVKKHETIGTVGKTGNAKNMDPHIHFEVIRSPGKLKWQRSGATGIKRGLYRIDPLPALRGSASLFESDEEKRPLSILKRNRL